MKLDFLKRFIPQRPLKNSRTAGAIVTGLPGGEVWPDRNYENYAKETYMKNVIAYRCIDVIAKSASSVPWKLLREIDEKKYEAVQEHPINAVLKRPNPRQSLTWLNYSIVSYLCIAGNSYVEKVSPAGGQNQGQVKELYCLRPDRMKIKTNTKGEISGYTYNANGQDIQFDVDPLTQRCDIMHLKLFHPTDDFYGMSPADPAAISIDTHNSSSMWNKKLIENEARPGAIFFFENTLTDAQFNRLYKQISESREGMQFAGKSLIIEGGRDVKPYGFSPTEMDWLNSNLELARNICNVYGVPAQMIGIPDTSTYSNYSEARLSFWEDTVLFYLQYLKDEFNHWLFPDNTEDLCLNYLLDDIPALAPKRDNVWERVQKADFLTINEKRESVEYEEIEGGDVLLIPATMLPLGESEQTEEETVKEDEEDLKKLQGLNILESDLND
jgi:HK97 family phage portal protein